MTEKGKDTDKGANVLAEALYHNHLKYALLQ
jgi:hypothetical protein